MPSVAARKRDGNEIKIHFFTMKCQIIKWVKLFSMTNKMLENTSVVICCTKPVTFTSNKVRIN